MAHPSLPCLPDELLLEITKHLISEKDGKTDSRALSNLSMTCWGLRPISVELILKDPLRDLTKVSSYALMLANNPELANKITTLEIISENPKTDLLERNVQKEDYNGHRKTVKTCQKIALATDLPGISNLEKAPWLYALQSGKIKAFLAVLFSLLPNLTDLRLADSGFNTLPTFNTLFLCGKAKKPISEPDYLDQVIRKLFPQLHSLTLPLKDPKGPITTEITNLDGLTSLRSLTVPGNITRGNKQHKDTPILPIDALPSSLESLTIMNALLEDKLFGLIPSLISNKDKVPKLQQIEVHCLHASQLREKMENDSWFTTQQSEGEKVGIKVLFRATGWEPEEKA